MNPNLDLFDVVKIETHAEVMYRPDGSTFHVRRLMFYRAGEKKGFTVTTFNDDHAPKLVELPSSAEIAERKALSAA
jgi:hypothetical protein